MSAANMMILRIIVFVIAEHLFYNLVITNQFCKVSIFRRLDFLPALIFYRYYYYY